MKLRVTFKTPDAVYDAVAEEMQRYAARLAEASGAEDISHDDLDGILDEKERELQAEAGRWFRYGEYVTIELDTEAHTATVVKP